MSACNYDALSNTTSGTQLTLGTRSSGCMYLCGAAQCGAGLFELGSHLNP